MPAPTVSIIVIPSPHIFEAAIGRRNTLFILSYFARLRAQEVIMLDIKFVRENPDLVKENIKKKFQDEKLPLVDEAIDLDKKLRDAKTEGDNLRAKRNKTSKEIGKLMGQGEKEKAEEVKKEVGEINDKLVQIEEDTRKYQYELKEK